MKLSIVPGHLAWTAAMLAITVLFAGCEQSQPTASDQQQTEGRQQKEDAAKPDAEPAADPEPEPAVLPDPEPVLDPEPDPTVEPQPDPVLEPDDEPATDPEPSTDPEPATDPQADQMPDLGPPLVDNLDRLQKLDPAKPVWVDQISGRVVLVGQICQTDTALELFACLKGTKEHEAIVTVDVEAFKVHAGLLAIGGEVGHPVKFDPEYVPAAGSEIEITVIYKDAQGQRQTVRAQDWILDVETGKAMTHPWVFAGSQFWEDEQTGQKHYLAEDGDFICVSNFSTAMLDLPIESSQTNSALMYKAFTERIPAEGTPVTLVLKPKAKKAEEP